MRDADDPVRIYQEALREFEEAKKRIRDVVETIRDGASKLKDWPRVKVINARTWCCPNLRYWNVQEKIAIRRV